MSKTLVPYLKQGNIEISSWDNAKFQFFRGYGINGYITTFNLLSYFTGTEK